MLERGAVLTCCMAAALCVWLASGEECAVASTCIHPVPRAAPPSLSAYENQRMIQCHMACISQQQIPIQLLNEDTAWTSYSFSTLPCQTQQKVDQCTLGCVTRHWNPQLTVNRCREECMSECGQRERSGQECNSISCRKTFCRFGCLTQENLQTASSATLPVPTAAPFIIKHEDSSSSRKLFLMNTSHSMPSHPVSEGSTTNQEPAQNVSHLYKVQQGNTSYYIWQKDISRPLDLSAFACEQIQVSFSVVTQMGYSNFSPAQSLCVDGVGGWPVSVDESSIRVSYKEDTREGFLRYAVLNVSWTRPHDHQYLTSYTIHLQTRTLGCGGLNNVYTYSNIDKDATWMVISTHGQNGMLLFGCSYLLSIVSLPQQQSNQNRITIIIAPELAEQDPEITLSCQREWDERGFLNISVSWSLSGLSPLSAIRRFSVIPLLIDNSQSGIFGRLYEYQRHWITAEEDKLDYSVYLTNFVPQTLQQNKYKIEVRVERNGQYLWRHIPAKESCTISAESDPPSIMTDITVSGVEIEREGLQEGPVMFVHFELTWLPPSTANGILLEYEIAVGTTASGPTDLLYRFTYPNNKLSARINTTLLHNASVQCLHAMMRSRNDYVWSEWSESVTIGLGPDCYSPTNTSLEDERVSVFYQRAGEEAVSIAELSCSNGLSSTPESISDLLHRLEQKLDEIPDMLRVQSSVEGVTERLERLESKLDQIFEAVSQTTPGE